MCYYLICVSHLLIELRLPVPERDHLLFVKFLLRRKFKRLSFSLLTLFLTEQLLSRLTLATHGETKARAAARQGSDRTATMGEDWNQIARGRMQNRNYEDFRSFSMILVRFSRILEVLVRF